MPLSCSFRSRQFIQPVSQRQCVHTVPSHFCRIWSHPSLFKWQFTKITHVHTAGWRLTECVWVFTLPPAHILCHHSSNQPPRRHDWIINHSINASLHSVRLRTSKYLPMQNNPRRLEYCFKLWLCAAHNQDGGGGIGGKTLALSSNFYADSQTSYVFGACARLRGEGQGKSRTRRNITPLWILVCKPLSH